LNHGDAQEGAHVADLPTGTVTFLFTDLEGSTRLWEEHPETMRHALERHDAILDAAVATRGGVVVKRTGDGVHAVFATADDAINAATDAQHAIARERWGEPGPLRIRMGLHSGVAQLRDGDYYGSSTNRAARLMSIAHGGQIVVSQATAELAADALDGVTFLDLGEHRLRDLDRPERVLQVCHASLDATFPPLRSLDAVFTNLPVQTTTFVGRAAELLDVGRALGEARAVTITGVGGVGKTRLAIQVAADVLPRYRDGAWFCELAGVGEPDAITETVAAALGVQPRIGQAMEEGVLDFLRAKELLLVLDNCEHLLDPVARFVDLVLRTSPRVTVLATSREGLSLPGERIFALPSLGVADEAVTLFVERASEARSGYVLDGDDSEAVTQICMRLDGIPLAIELAAARVHAMTPTEIAARLDDQFRLLTRGRRTGVERHQTLRRAIDWSYDLLSHDERVVLQRLSVFAGGFMLDAAEAVTGADGIDALDVLDHLETLVRRSLVVADQASGQTRYRLLETIRQYGQDRLEEVGQEHAVGRRHATYYAHLAEAAGPHLRAADQLAWIARLAPEVDNLRVAAAWSLDNDDLDLALSLLLAVSVNGIDLGYLALSWAEAAATAPGIDRHPLGPALLAQAAWHSVMHGQLDRAQEHESRRVAIQAALGLEPRPADLQAPATIAIFSGDLDTAIERAREWVALARADNDRYELVQGLTFLAAALQADVPSVLRAVEEAVAEARQLGNPSSLSWALTVATLFLSDADPEAAIAVFEEAVELGRAAGNEQGVAAALGALAAAYVTLGDTERALTTHVDALRHALRLGDHFSLARMLATLASVLSGLGDYESASVVTGACDAFREVPDPLPVVLKLRAQSIAACETALGRDLVAALQARGAAMHADEAVAFAIDAAEELLE
jgi:predicted ATPase/class 3 adenylate cyclase